MTDSLTVRDALGIASRWISDSNLPFQSAFIGGSVAYADPESTYDSASDIDCYLVVAGQPPDGKIGKITVHGVLLDVSWLGRDMLANADSDAVLASLLHFGCIVRDSDGELTELKQEIDANFERESTIDVRLEDMRRRIRPLANRTDQHLLPQAEQIMNWLFPATLATHIPLIRACAPLTVRKRFLAAKRVMEMKEYEELLALYGFDTVIKETVQHWLDDTAVLVDFTAPYAETSSRFWSSDIRADARSIAIGGSQQLIDEGFHREALYWIIATRTRCLTVLNDSGQSIEKFEASFRQMVGELQISSPEERAVRTEKILEWIEN